MSSRGQRASGQRQALGCSLAPDRLSSEKESSSLSTAENVGCWDCDFQSAVSHRGGALSLSALGEDVHSESQSGVRRSRKACRPMPPKSDCGANFMGQQKGPRHQSGSTNNRQQYHISEPRQEETQLEKEGQGRARRGRRGRRGNGPSGHVEVEL